MFDIGKKHRLSVRTVQRILRQAADTLRAENHTIVEQALLLQLERIERLYVLLEREFDAYQRELEGWLSSPEPRPERPRIDTGAIRAAVSLFERQARLLGLDRGDPTKGRGKGGWLDDAPIEQVLEYAKQLYVDEPKPFDA